MLWNVNNGGFLPFSDPVAELHPDLPGVDKIEETARSLPDLVAAGNVRESLVLKLQDLPKTFNDVFIAVQCLPAHAERAMMLFSYFASSYIHAPGQPQANFLPKEIAVPLTEFAKIVNRPPILSYASYCLYNWERLDWEKPIELGNIKLLQNFTLSDGRRDENWFILVHVDIEAKAAKGIAALNKLFVKRKNEDVGVILADVYESLNGMYETLCRMPEECSTDVYYSKVRPYIFSYDSVVYDGCGGGRTPLSYRGETGAQSSCIPAFQTALGVKHKNSMLTTHLKDMRNYMPLEHRNWLASLEAVTSVDNLRTLAEKNGLKDEYNKCLGRLISFRTKHLEYAINYIQNKVTNPTGTGGTPYIQWLSQLVQETEEFML